MQGEGRSHDREHIGGHVRLDVDAEAWANPIIQGCLNGWHSMPHLHLDRSCDRDFSTSVRNIFPCSLTQSHAMNVFIVRAHEAGLSELFKRLRITNDMVHDRRANLSSKRPNIGVRSPAHCESQQLVIRREIAHAQPANVLWISNSRSYSLRVREKRPAPCFEKPIDAGIRVLGRVRHLRRVDSGRDAGTNLAERSDEL